MLFVAVERRAPEPLIELSLFRNVKFDVITLAGSLSNVVYCLIAVLAALYLQQARGLSPFHAGVIFLALSCGVGAASYWAGQLALRWRAELLMACGMLTSGAGLLALTWVRSLGWYAVVFVVCGVGIGLGWALTNVATQAHVPAERTGAASGLVLTSLVLFGAVSVTIAATVLETISGSPTTAASDGPAIETVLRGTSVLAFLGAFGLFAICRPRLLTRRVAVEDTG
ncbi:MFS transporter [Streptomyces sp. NEAU-S7GS2]|uniref:MFS transporter n=1 Tax=Streptomyces sp. NEAU-S7GS2 TaxID=2202000 RepID=UPI00195250EC|nr:MFS transporter [Streptomyces sp. NEAU-S7GS2]